MQASYLRRPVIKIRLQLPEVKPEKPNPLPPRCPNPKKLCQSNTFHRHQPVSKKVRDVQVKQVQAQRWQCTVCGYTFRVYPQGVSHRQQSERLRAMSVLLWVLGLSFGAVVDFLYALDCPLQKTTIYDNVRVAGKGARKRLRARLQGKVKVRVLGTDCTHEKVNGQDKVLIQAIDVEKGRTLEIEILPGEDERTIVRYVQRMAKLVEAEVLISDDADAFKTAADAAGLKHQICQRHVVPNTLKLVSEIGTELLSLSQAGITTAPAGLGVEQALLDVAELEMLVLARTPSSQAALEALQQRYQVASPPTPGKKASPFYRLRLLTMDLAEDWSRLTLSEHCRAQDGRRLVPPTNNASEQRIGLNIKERYRTIRGYKSKWSARQVPALIAWLREAEEPQALYALLVT
jgi:transposase-like protein